MDAPSQMSCAALRQELRLAFDDWPQPSSPLRLDPKDYESDFLEPFVGSQWFDVPAFIGSIVILSPYSLPEDWLFYFLPGFLDASLDADLQGSDFFMMMIVRFLKSSYSETWEMKLAQLTPDQRVAICRIVLALLEFNAFDLEDSEALEQEWCVDRI